MRSRLFSILSSSFFFVFCLADSRLASLPRYPIAMSNNWEDEGKRLNLKLVGCFHLFFSNDLSFPRRCKRALGYSLRDLQLVVARRSLLVGIDVDLSLLRSINVLSRHVREEGNGRSPMSVFLRRMTDCHWMLFFAIFDTSEQLNDIVKQYSVQRRVEHSP